MGYAEVCVNSPAARRQTFTYSIPSHMEIAPGQAVLVPFGAQILQGIVLGITAEPASEPTRDITEIITPRPLLSADRIELARWISDYYLATIFDAVALLLPPGFERKLQTFVTACAPQNLDIASLTPDQQQVLETVAKQTKVVRTTAIARLFGKKKAQQVINQLVKKHLLVKSYRLEPIKVKGKVERIYALIPSLPQARQVAEKLRPKAKKQSDLLMFLADAAGSASVGIIRKNIGFNKRAADSLLKKGYITETNKPIRRDPLADLEVNLSWPLPLTPKQGMALNTIRSSLGKSTTGISSGELFLLHGVTGSGKTEVYLQALAEVVSLGKKGIVLVPEISLTPQTLERFTSRFPGKVAVLHSQLTLGEQFDEWDRIRNGQVDVVIGPRSALFAPLPNLGLIVIDEEHEWSYKQSDRSPTYHTRNVAIKLAKLTGASVILGSATPDVETYYHARQGEYVLLELPERLISEAETQGYGETGVQNRKGASMPEVDVVDMREELKNGNRSLFSRALRQAIDGALSAGGQVILFLNRRGASTFIQCRRCGYSFRCRRCDVSMTYHAAEVRVICHQCNNRARRPEVCPRCRSGEIKFIGLGTEKLEQETAKEFPRARLLRWDSDTTRSWLEHQAILDKFRRHEAEILIGTQMVSKGLDMPRVTLAGIINADTGLYLPDFRAGERTYQLLSQVAGRAGRGVMGGRVIIQTYSPEHYAIQAAKYHDYLSFYTIEIGYRRALRKPPFTQLIRLTYNNTKAFRCRNETERMKQTLLQESAREGVNNVSIIGPAPAFISRRRGHFRWQLILCGSNVSPFLSKISLPPGWTIDVDPLGLS